MNKKIKNIVLPVATLLVGVGIASGIAVHAASTSSTGQNPVSNLVTAIAQKFNLNTADVQQVFDDQHAQREQQHQQMIADRLAQAVKDGKLTQDQSDKITAKMKDLQAQREADKSSFGSMTQAQRQAKMQQDQASLKQWATDNNIPAEYLPLVFGGGHGGPGHHGGFGGNDGDADDIGQPAASQSINSTTNATATTNTAQ